MLSYFHRNKLSKFPHLGYVGGSSVKGQIYGRQAYVHRVLQRRAQAQVQAQGQGQGQGQAKEQTQEEQKGQEINVSAALNKVPGEKNVLLNAAPIAHSVSSSIINPVAEIAAIHALVAAYLEHNPWPKHEISVKNSEPVHALVYMSSNFVRYTVRSLLQHCPFVERVFIVSTDLPGHWGSRITVLHPMHIAETVKGHGAARMLLFAPGPVTIVTQPLTLDLFFAGTAKLPRCRPVNTQGTILPILQEVWDLEMPIEEQEAFYGKNVSDYHLSQNKGVKGGAMISQLQIELTDTPVSSVQEMLSDILDQGAQILAVTDHVVQEPLHAVYLEAGLSALLESCEFDELLDADTTGSSVVAGAGSSVAGAGSSVVAGASSSASAAAN